MLNLETPEEREYRHEHGPMDLGSLLLWNAVTGMESVAIDSPIPTAPESATYRRGRKVGSRGTVARRSAVSEHRNLYVIGADDERGYGRELAGNLEARADMLLMHDLRGAEHAEECDCSRCEYPTGTRTVGTATRAWADVSPDGLAGMVQHVAWHHDTMVDSIARVTGAAWHEAEQWADEMGADPPTRRTDRGTVRWTDSTASTLQHAVRDDQGEYVLDEQGERIYVPTVLAEVGAWRDGRHWQVTLYGTVFTTWAPAGKVENTRTVDTGGGWRESAPRRIIRGTDGRLVRKGKRARAVALPGETVETWQSTGRTWIAPTSTVQRTTVRTLIKRARHTYNGEHETWQSTNGARAAARLTKATTAAITREQMSNDAMRDAIAGLDPGARVRLRVGAVTVNVRRLDQSDAVYRLSIGRGKNVQKRGAERCVVWIERYAV